MSEKLKKEYDEHNYLISFGEFCYEKGKADERAKVLDEVLSILVSDGDYGHETFSLTYLRGLLKSLKEQKNEIT